jgi:homoserine kinase
MRTSHEDEIVIKVPGSIANLGPGFDTLAVAVQLYLTLRVRRAHGEGNLRFEFLNQKLEGENYIERAFRFIAARHEYPIPSLDIHRRSS